MEGNGEKGGDLTVLLLEEKFDHENPADAVQNSRAFLSLHSGKPISDAPAAAAV